jgi:type IV pilus assembly protein PilA
MSEPAKTQKPSKGKVVVAAVILAVGLIAAVGWSMYRAVSDGSQDKSIIGNLRQIRAGADYYFVQHPGVTSVASTTIVGTNPSDYVKSFTTVAQESYTPIIVPEQAVTASGVAGARTVTYGP